MSEPSVRTMAVQAEAAPMTEPLGRTEAVQAGAAPMAEPLGRMMAVQAGAAPMTEPSAQPVTVTVYGADISRIRPDRFYEQIRTLPQALQERVRRCRSYPDRCRRLTGYLLLEQALWAHCQKRLSDVAYRVGAQGKPYLEGAGAFHFNLSHSGRLAVCAAACVPVGVDVQETRAVRAGVAERFFTGRENELLLRCDRREERDRLFFRIWCVKEAYVKWNGAGLGAGIEQLETDIDAGRVWRSGAEDGNAEHLEEAFLAQPDLRGLCGEDETYYLAVCGGAPLRIRAVWEKEPAPRQMQP